MNLTSGEFWGLITFVTTLCLIGYYDFSMKTQNDY